MTQLTQKQAIAFIVALGVLCIGLGVASGMVIERRRAEGYFCQMGKTHPLGYFPRAGGSMHQQGGFMHKQGGPMHQQGALMPKRDNFRQKAGRFFRQEGPGKDTAANLCARISEKLDLSAEQQKQVEAVLEENRKEVAQASDNFKTQLKAVKEKNHSQILELLTPEQKEKFEAMDSMMEGRMGRGHRGMME